MAFDTGAEDLILRKRARVGGEGKRTTGARELRTSFERKFIQRKRDKQRAKSGRRM
jgi:hypothetical protein